MCGIACLMAAKSGNLSAIHAMTELVSHRGPDDEGYLFVNERGALSSFGGASTPDVLPLKREFDGRGACLAMGHRRLSIVDLSPQGHQPFISRDGSFCLTYNGEIYNHIELREELKSRGYTFHTESDTEVLITAWEEWGPNCLERFNGMFAFVLYDCMQKKLYAVRDRFGIKPLYYTVLPSGEIAFASEIKQFTALPTFHAALNSQRAYDFLNWGIFDHTEETLFTGVFQLRGSEMLSLSHKEAATCKVGKPLKTVQWYEIQEREVKNNFQEAALEYRELLIDAVRLRLRADVDIGSCLSGGLDSSTIVCLASEKLRSLEGSNRQKTFSSCSEDPRLCEREYMDAVIKATAVVPHFSTPNPNELFDLLEKIVWHQDGPFGSTSIFAQWQLFALAKRAGVPVMLDGQGADEQLCGYHGFFGHRHYELFCSLRWKKLWQELKRTKEVHPHIPAFSLLASKLLPHSFCQPLRRAFGKAATKPKWLNIDGFAIEDSLPFAKTGCRTIKAQSTQQLLKSSLPMLLHYEDRDSMAHSIEARTPFLDYRLVEYTLSAPSHYKIEGSTTKRLLRESMKGILPPLISQRSDKVAFATAEELWMKNGCQTLFREGVKRSVELSSGLITPQALDELEAMINGRTAFSFLPWRLISFGAFLQRFSITPKRP